MELINKHDFKNGVKLTKERMEKLHNEVLDELEQNPDLLGYSIRCGNGFVRGPRDTESKLVTIYEVDTGYRTTTYQE